MPKLDVALVNQPYDQVLPPRQNSMGLIGYNTALALSRDADVRVYARRLPHGNEALALPFQLRYTETPWDEVLESVTRRLPRLSQRLGLHRLREQYPDYARRVAAALGRSPPDIVHVMNYWTWSRQLRPRHSSRRLVLEMQCEWLSQFDPARVGRQLEAVDAVVGVSNHITTLFRDAFPRYPGIVATAWNGVDVDVFCPASERAATPESDGPLILFVGRVSPEKGVHTLLDALAELVRHMPDARLEIVGGRGSLAPELLVGLSSDPLVSALLRFYDGRLTTNYWGYLQARVRRHGLEKHVRFAGVLPHSELVAIYQRADLVVNPSLSESFGISVIEGMACGVPVVATGVGGMRDTVLEGVTGLLVDPEQPELLAGAMKSILGDRDRSARMAAAGRARAMAEFTWAARARRLLEVYRRLV